MRNKDIEKRLTQAVSNSVPNVLDNILVKCEKKKGFEKKVVKKKEQVKTKDKFIIRPRLVGAFAMVMVMAFTFVGLTNYNSNYKVDATIEFDVNPSIEIEVNKKEEIIKINALNEDAKKVLDDMDFKGVDLDIAVNAIIGSMLKNGYLTVDQNSILVSVKNDDKEKGEQLQQKLSKEIQEILSASKLDGSVITQEYETNAEIKKIANNNNISEGKAELIKRILDAKLKDAKGNLYKEEDLAKLSINELKLLLEEKETTLKNVKTSHAKTKIKAFLNKQKREEYIQRGYEELEIVAKQYNYDLKELTDKKASELFANRSVKTVEDLYREIGKGNLSALAAINKILGLTDVKLSDEVALQQYSEDTSNVRIRRSQNGYGIIVEGLDKAQIKLGNCCQPVLGDQIVGFISRGNGIIAHREECPNVHNSEVERLINLSWDPNFKGRDL